MVCPICIIYSVSYLPIVTNRCKILPSTVSPKTVGTIFLFISRWTSYHDKIGDFPHIFPINISPVKLENWWISHRFPTEFPANGLSPHLHQGSGLSTRIRPEKIDDQTLHLRLRLDDGSVNLHPPWHEVLMCVKPINGVMIWSYMYIIC